MAPKWSRNCAISQIKRDIEEDKSLTNILDSFFPQQQTFERPEKSAKFITTVFVHWFLLFLPEKGKEFIQRFLNPKILDENFVIEWIEVVYGHQSNNILHALLTTAPFYHIFADLKINNATIDLTKFYLKLRSHFRACFLETKALQGILEVYRCLLYCKTKTKRSKVFCEAVKILWKKLNFKNDVLMIEADDSLEDDEHKNLLKLVEKLGDENNEKIKDKIRDIFNHENTSFSIDNQKLIIQSYKIELTNIWEELNNKIKNNDFEITSVEIIATEIILDQNFILPGKNLTLISKNLLIPYKVEINLSGNNAIDKFGLISAESGKFPGEKGGDGKDGNAGGSAGNCTILTESVTEASDLKVCLNGGNGSKGQNGGDGANGEDGKGADFDIINNQKVLIKLKHVANLLTGGIYSRTFGSESETVANDGTKIFSNDSAMYFSTHSYRLYVGSEGKIGGNGGKNGLGGKGGEGGEFCLIVNNRDKKDTVKMETIKGCDGVNGNVGENGQPGLIGWDIAITGKTLEKEKFTVH
uniref:Uncharacterized protein n=1 Tax=Panagrolaimus superbus TaxID=310955 RepID=A0A914XVN0_9BILA